MVKFHEWQEWGSLFAHCTHEVLVGAGVSNGDNNFGTGVRASILGAGDPAVLHIVD